MTKIIGITPASYQECFFELENLEVNSSKLINTVIEYFYENYSKLNVGRRYFKKQKFELGKIKKYARISLERYKWLERIAYKYQISVSEVIRVAIDKYFEKRFIDK